jgi:hypothetical protein
MHRMRMAALFMLIVIAVTALAACGGAPAPQSSDAATVPAANRSAPTAGIAPTAAVAPTAGVAATARVPTAATAPTTVAAATSATLADTNPAKPDDKTQAACASAAVSWMVRSGICS